MTRPRRATRPHRLLRMLLVLLLVGLGLVALPTRATAAGPPVPTTPPLPDAVVAQPYSATLSATGGTPPYTWSVTAGTLPQGLGLDATTGAITGTPTAPGTTTLVFQVTDATDQNADQTLTLLTRPGPLTLQTTPPLPDATVAAPYSVVLAATGGTVPYSWDISSGALPAGLALHPTSGIVDGTPTTAGTAVFTVRATDAGTGGFQQTAQQTFTIVVQPPDLVATTAPFAPAQVGSPYTALLTARGGSPPYSWAVAAGTLPTGLVLTAATGAVSGTPATAGATTVTFRVTDSAARSAEQTLALTVNPAQLLSTTALLPNATTGQPYSAFLTATGGSPPYSWALTTGTLPTGLTLDPATGALSGTPTAAGTATLTFQVTDSAARHAQQALPLTVLDASHPHITAARTIATPGSDLTVTGGSLPAGQTVTVRLTGGPESATALTDATGAFSLRLSVYPDSSAGIRTLEVFEAGVATPVATSSLLVVEGSLIPPDFTTRH